MLYETFSPHIRWSLPSLAGFVSIWWIRQPKRWGLEGKFPSFHWLPIRCGIRRFRFGGSIFGQGQNVRKITKRSVLTDFSFFFKKKYPARILSKGQTWSFFESSNFCQNSTFKNAYRKHENSVECLLCLVKQLICGTTYRQGGEFLGQCLIFPIPPKSLFWAMGRSFASRGENRIRIPLMPLGAIHRWLSRKKGKGKNSTEVFLRRGENGVWTHTRRGLSRVNSTELYFIQKLPNQTIKRKIVPERKMIFLSFV